MLWQVSSMSVSKDVRRGTWCVHLRYRDVSGLARSTTKRGFKTEPEARKWELERLKAVTIPDEINADRFEGSGAPGDVPDVG